MGAPLLLERVLLCELIAPLLLQRVLVRQLLAPLLLERARALVKLRRGLLQQVERLRLLRGVGLVTLLLELEVLLCLQQLLCRRIVPHKPASLARGRSACLGGLGGLQGGDELLEVDRAIVILIDLIEDRVRLLLRGLVSKRRHRLLELRLRHLAVLVLVPRLEDLVSFDLASAEHLEQ